MAESDCPLLGYFYEMDIVYQMLPFTRAPYHGFISTSSKGKLLQQGKSGSLDDTLGFLPQATQIVGSSNGWLLCTTDIRKNMQYIVCNPVTKQFRVLPQSHSCRFAPVAFICKGDKSSMELCEFEIVRTIVSEPKKWSQTLQLETYSSEKGEWKKSSIDSSSPFKLMVAEPPFILEEVVYWKSSGDFSIPYEFVAYDRARQLAEVVKCPVLHKPEGELGFRGYSLGVSDGKIYYAHTSRHYLELWVLENGGNSRNWNLKYDVSFKSMIQKNPNLNAAYVRDLTLGSLVVVGLHPNNPHLIMVDMHRHHLWYHAETGKLKVITTHLSSSDYTLFPYE